MGFEIAHALRSHAGIGEGSGDHRRLAVHARGGEGGLFGTVVVDGTAANGGVDGVAVGDGVFEALEHHAEHTGGQHHAAGTGIEGADVAVAGERAIVLGQIARVPG